MITKFQQILFFASAVLEAFLDITDEKTLENIFYKRITVNISKMGGYVSSTDKID